MNADVSGVQKIEEFGREFGLFNEVLVTARRVGLGKEFWAKLAHDKTWFAELASVFAGRSSIVHNDYFVKDSDLPKINGLSVLAHKQYGSQKLMLAEIALAKNDNETRDYLNYHYFCMFRDNSFLIPRSWREKVIMFSGTTFRSSEGHGITGKYMKCGLRVDSAGGVSVHHSFDGATPIGSMRFPYRKH